MAKQRINTQADVEALKQLIKEFKSLASQLKTTTQTLTQLQGSLTAVTGVTKESGQVIAELQKQLKNANTTKKRFITTTRNLKKANKELQQQIDNTNKSAKKSGGTFKLLVGSAKKLIGAFGILTGFRLFAKIVQDSFKLIVQLDSINFAMKTITKSAEDLANAQSFLLKITSEYGLELVGTAERYTKFLAAAQQVNLSTRETEKIFNSVSKASAVLGLRADEVRGVYLALEQMLSKGKVTTEELRRQLGERLPGAMGIMADAIGVSIDELDKMMKKGEVLSSEALPKFAIALESAYGLDKVDKIDTLVAAQGRLNTSMKIFAKNLIEANPAFEQFIKDVKNSTAEMIRFFAVLFGTEEAKFRSELSDATKFVTKEYKKSAKAIVNASAEKGKTLLEIEKRISDAIKLQGTYVTKEQKKAADKAYKEAIADKIEFEEKIQAEEIKRARLEIVRQTDRFKNAQEAYRKNNAQIDKLELAKRERTLKRDEQLELTRRKKQRDALRTELAESQAAYTIARDFLVGEIDKTNKVIESKKTPLLFTGEIDKEIAKIKAEMKDYQLIMKGLREESNQDRLEAQNRFIDLRIALIKKEEEKELMVLSNKLAKQLEKEDLGKQEILAIRKDFIAQKEAIEIKHGTKIQDILNNTEVERIDLIEEFTKDQLTRLEKKHDDIRNLEIIALRQRYGDISKLSKEEVQAYQKELDEIERKHNNNKLEAMAEYLEKLIEALGLEGEIKKEFQQKINEFLAKMRDEDVKKEKMSFEKRVEFLREFAASAFDVADAFVQRRIENINAEIEAERKKYDAMIEMAKDDVSKREMLEQERDAKLALLEKKRLKEEQKAARIRKAQALTDIAINTAVAYMATLGKTGFFGIPLAKIVLAMGALQAAAVMAQPIPQYKDGVKDLHEDQVAMINDGGQKEYVERDGKILSTDTKNAIVQLRKGDTVHKNYDSMVKDSILYNLIAQGQPLSQSKFDSLGEVIKNGIDQGFKRAKIQNNIVFNHRSRNKYLDNKSRFN